MSDPVSKTPEEGMTADQPGPPRSRVQKLLCWGRSHPKRSTAAVLLAGFTLLNVAAFLHARAMTHYRDGGTKTAAAQSLGVLHKAQVLLTGVSVPRPTNGRTPAVVNLPFEVCRFPSEGGGELEAWHVPHPRPHGLVLLFHGYAGCKSALLHQARAFYDTGYSSLLVDFRGSGGSSGSVTTVGAREAGDVAAAFAYARSQLGTRRMILYGHSMGGAAVLRAIARHGVRPDAVIAECTFDRLLHTVGNRFRLMGLPAFPAAHLLVFWGGVQCGFDGFDHNPAEDAAAVTCPTLVLHGDKDPTVTEAQARSIYDNLGGEKQFELFLGVGHEPIVTARPERWRAAVSEFLTGSAHDQSPDQTN